MEPDKIPKLAKADYYAIYAKAHNNAIALLREAEILHEKRHYARAYFLAFTGLEELSKSQLAADVYTNFITEEKFHKKYNKHQEKIELVSWASYDAADYVDADTEDYLQIKLPKLKNRMAALYVDIDNNKIKSPEDTITEPDSKMLIHTLRVGIEKVVEITEYWGHQIGSKGFLK